MLHTANFAPMRYLIRSTLTVCLLATLWAMTFAPSPSAGARLGEGDAGGGIVHAFGIGHAHADDDDAGWRDLHQEVEQGRLVGLPSVLDWLEAHYIGQVVEVELEREDGAPVYEIEMIGPEGQVVEFEFDAVNGELIGIEGVGIKEMQRR